MAKYHRVEAQIKNEVIKIQNGVLRDYFKNSYSFFDAAYSMRNSVLNALIEGNVKKGDHGIHIDAMIQYRLTDDFTDPSNYRETVRGTSSREHADPISDAGGTVYYVTGYWRTRLTGLVKGE